MNRLAALLCLASAALLSITTLPPLPADARRIAVLLYLMVATLQTICARHADAALPLGVGEIFTGLQRACTRARRNAFRPRS